MSDPTPVSTPAIVVLLVDDQRMIGEVVRRMLLDQPDLAFHYCGDPLQAVEIASQIRPTVILQDLIMPGLHGLELAKLFRAHPVTARTPIILLTASDEGNVQSEAVAAGVNDFLMKLPNRADLVACIRAYASAAGRMG